MSKRALAWIAVATILTMGIAACRPFPGGGSNPLRDRPVFSQAGPYAAGVTTLSLGDRQVEVWYPTSKRAVRGHAKDVYRIRTFLPALLQAIIPPDIDPPYETDAYRDVAPARNGPFPLVLFSHGSQGWRLQSTFLTSHLASWGFVVASPDFLERGLQQLFQPPLANPKGNTQVLREAVDRLKAADAEPGGLLHGVVDARQVVPIGHSAGGFGSTQFASQPDVPGWISLSAGAGSTTVLPAKPSMWIGGVDDGIAPITSLQTAYANATAPKRFVSINGTGHLNGFSEICKIGEGGGGLIALARQAGIPVPPELERLGTDGCFEPFLDSPTVWPVTRHFVTAEMRVLFGIDRFPIGLGPRVADAFPGVSMTYEQVLR